MKYNLATKDGIEEKQGFEFEINDVKLILHDNIGSMEILVVSDFFTGIQIAYGDTISGAISRAEKNLNKISIEEYNTRCRAMLKEYNHDYPLNEYS